jgi:hypothetical protein
MISEEEKKWIDSIIFRLNKEVIKTMKKIRPNELYGWKGEKEINEK